MKPGYDLLGLAHPLFDLKSILPHISVDSPVGWMWAHFGDSRSKFRYMLEKGYTIFRIQMYWADDHSIVPVNVLNKYLLDLRDTVEKSAKEIRLYISPSCEHTGTEGEVRDRLELVKRILPYSIPVNNPLAGKGAEVPGVLNEHHGGSPGRCDLASTDGTNIYDIDAAKWVRKYGNKEHPCFLWGARFNLREISDPGQKPPPVKDRKAAPSVEYFKSVQRLADSKGRAFSPTFSATPIKSPNIWKTHAEDDQEESERTLDEKRENRPVLIIKSSVNIVDIIDYKKNVLGKLIRYGDVGSFEGGLTRYYSGLPDGINLYGYEIGEIAKATGSEFVWFRAGKTIYGPVNPAFRAGKYR